jgi:hypothetical protein
MTMLNTLQREEILFLMFIIAIIAIIATITIITPLHLLPRLLLHPLMPPITTLQGTLIPHHQAHQEKDQLLLRLDNLYQHYVYNQQRKSRLVHQEWNLILISLL